ncbi:hypothetical protein BKA66DRAFT_417681 [Pyrenochaeta sp. MPI-SDFR-AT-0127]|nr:hypothetical protein BKA66DRAFT_417681 [Pyrenochaeta sp. MPI-SDFR-AT-0127]
MKITQMLNPTPRGGYHGHRRTGLPAPMVNAYPVAAATQTNRQKVAKDMPIFLDGNTVVGIVNFPPHEAGCDQELISQHRRFQVYPSGDICNKSVRHIPYSSDKKDFMDKTGHDAFEVFQYTFKRPGEEKEYVVIWDYNIGLVRMTPFFKSLKHVKASTMPAKALNANPGLKDISYSITGGALVCQGYWIPYHAARAIAATFCYDIRWALTPVFGNDFPSLCLQKKDPGFAKFLIDPTIVEHCAAETDRARTEGKSYSVLRSDPVSPVDNPKTHFDSLVWSAATMEQGSVVPVDLESGYGTDSDQSYKHLFSPAVSPRSQCTWVSVNEPQFPKPLLAASPSEIGSPINLRATQGLLPAASPTTARHDQPRRTKRTRSKSRDTGDSENWSPTHTSETISSDDRQDSRGFGGERDYSSIEIDAAKTLMAMSVGLRGPLPSTKRIRRGSMP